MDPLTADTQAILESLQNPADCSSAKYFIWDMRGYGLGSDLHTLGWAIGLAVKNNRVLLHAKYVVSLHA